MNNLQKAYTKELEAIEFYSRLSQFGWDDEQIFARIVAIRAKGIELLGFYASAQDIALNDETKSLYMPDSFQDSLICACSYEIANGAFYDELCQNESDESLQDLLFRIWATSQNEFIPALKMLLAKNLSAQQSQCEQNEHHHESSHQSQAIGGGLESYFGDLSKLKAQLEKAASGKLDPKELSGLLKHPQFSLFSGAAIGAILATTLLNSKKDKDEE